MKSREVIGTVLFVILALTTSDVIARDGIEPAAYRFITNGKEEVPASPAEKAEVLPSPSGKVRIQESYLGNHHQDYSGEACNFGNCGGCEDTCCEPSCMQPRCPRWTATADYIIFDRIGTSTRTLLREVPIGSISAPPGEEVLNSNDFSQGFHGGPRVSLIHQGPCRCYDLELLYFQIDGWNDARLITPDADHLLVFSVPGANGGNSNFSSSDPILFDYSSKLYNGELNVRWHPLCRVTMLAGFRWVDLQENLDGGTLIPELLPFWNTKTKNDLYGFQIGTDAKLWESCRFSIDGLVKAGVYCNHAEQTSTKINLRVVEDATVSTNHPAFLGEVGLQCKYQVTCRLSLRAGYEAMWIEGVALAPGQIERSNFITDQFGINTNGGVLYHGATAGLEYSF
jgi:hypothetical protein